MKKSILLSIVLFAVMAATIVAAIPTTFNLQGYLVDADGKPVNERVTFIFNLWDADSGGNNIHTETINGGVDVTEGYYNARLGLPAGIAGIVAQIKGPDYLWYELTINGTPQGRIPFDAVPYAVGAKYAEEAEHAKPIGPAGGILAGTYPNPDINKDVLTNIMKDVVVRAIPTGEARGKEIQGKYPDDLVIANRAVQSYHIALNAVKTANIDTGAVTLDRLAKPADETRNNLIWWNKNLTGNFKWQYATLGDVLGGPLNTGFLPKWDAVNDKFVNSSISDINRIVVIDADSTNLAGNLGVVGKTTLYGTTAINSTLAVTGVTTLNGLLNNGISTLNGATAINNTLAVTGATTLNGLLNNGISTLNGATAINNTLAVTGATTLNGLLNNGTSTLNGATTINNTLDVTGLTTLAGLNAQNTTLLTLAVTNNATIGGTLGVTDNTTLAGTLGVTGATTLNGATAINNTLSVVGNYATTLGGTLTVTGLSTFNGASIFNNGITVNNVATNINAGLLVDGSSHNATYVNTLSTNKYMPAGATDATFTTKNYVDYKTNIVLTDVDIMPTTTINPTDGQKQLTNSNIHSRTATPWNINADLGYNYIGMSGSSVNTHIDNSILFGGIEVFFPTAKLYLGQGNIGGNGASLNIDVTADNTGLAIVGENVIDGATGFFVDLSNGTEGMAGYFVSKGDSRPTVYIANDGDGASLQVDGSVTYTPDNATLTDVKHGTIFTVNVNSNLPVGNEGQVIYIINTAGAGSINITGVGCTVYGGSITFHTAASFIFANGNWYPVK